jgi:para-nitrobenzyl esterase
MVSGCTTDEMMAFMQGDPELWNLNEDGVRLRLSRYLGDDVDTMLTAYRKVRPDDSPTSLLIALVTDAAMRIPHVRLAEAKLQGGGAPVWMYLFAWGPPDPTGRVRSGHGSDMPYFFDNVDKAPRAAGPQAEPLVKAMSGALAALAHTGNPNHDGLPEWPPYDTEQRSSMRIDVPSVIEFDPFGAERRCWDGLTVGGLVETP